MSQDALRLDEACQHVKNTIAPQLSGWTQEALREVMEPHAAVLQQPGRNAEKQALVKQGLEEAVQHRLKRRMVREAFSHVEELGMFSSERLLMMQNRVVTAFHSIPLTVSVSMPHSNHLLDPWRSAIVVGVFAVLGAIVDGLISQKLSLFTFLFPGLGASLLADLQLRSNRALKKQSWWAQILSLLWTEDKASFSWQEEARANLEKLLQDALEQVIVLIRLSGQLEGMKQEQARGDMETLQHFFAKTQDGLAEIYYSELKRDEERALDACIKFVGDLEQGGIEVRTLERGQPFESHMLDAFEVHGRIEEGDPVQLIYPAWSYQGQLLMRGTLKKGRRR